MLVPAGRQPSSAWMLLEAKAILRGFWGRLKIFFPKMFPLKTCKVDVSDFLLPIHESQVEKATSHTAVSFQ